MNRITQLIRSAPVGADQSLTVLHSLQEPHGPTKYASHMKDSAPSDVRMKFFSWRSALFGSYDVFHVHWPEYLFRGSNRFIAAIRKALFVTLMIRLKLLKRPLVRTLHNIEPHDGSDIFDDALMRFCNRSTSLYIRLNALTPVPQESAYETILHGHYVDRFGSHRRADTIFGSILYFGLIRPYKGVPRLISVFRELDRQDLRLRIVGKPSSEALATQIQAASFEDPRISLDLRFVDDSKLVEEISASELVVLPYAEMHNSGAILVALSLNRPVIAPATPANQALSAEVGVGWVHLYDGELTPGVLQRAILATRDMPTKGTPNLGARSWETVGEQHRKAYRRAIGLMRKKSSAPDISVSTKAN